MDLFDNIVENEPRNVQLAPGAVLLTGFARSFETPLLTAASSVVECAPFRHLVYAGGHRMSVAMTSCGTAGWSE